MAEAGTVIIHAAPIEIANCLLTNFLLARDVDEDFLSGFSLYSLKKPIPKIAPMAICVELTGKPKVVAIRTVIAEDKATQYALGAFNLVIFWPTVLINLGPNKSKPKAIPMAPITITHNGIDTFAAIPSLGVNVLTIAASGPTALATSLAP